MLRMLMDNPRSLYCQYHCYWLSMFNIIYPHRRIFLLILIWNFSFDTWPRLTMWCIFTPKELCNIMWHHVTRWHDHEPINGQNFPSKLYQNPHLSQIFRCSSPQNLQALHLKLWDAHQVVLQGISPRSGLERPNKSKAVSEVSMEHVETWNDWKNLLLQHWLVLWNNNPNCLSIFFRGVQTTNQNMLNFILVFNGLSWPMYCLIDDDRCL